VLEVGRALSGRRRCWAAGSVQRSKAGAQPHRPADGRAAGLVAAAAAHRARTGGGARDADLDDQRDLETDRDGTTWRLGLEPARRYERERPGELIHIDVKKLGRISGGAGKRVTGIPRNTRRSRTDAAGVRRHQVGWDAVHVAIDDATRLAYVEVLPDEKALTAVGFLRRAVAHFQRHGITVERVITDNGSPYVSSAHKIACAALGIRHLRTRPYRPQTNGKAERFIRTLLGGWAYGAIYRSSAERTAALDGWLHHYNHHRKHSALGRQPPITRLNNLPGSYI
jgi:transposase InsO family protein